MSDPIDKPRIIDPLYLMNLPPSQMGWEELNEMCDSLSELAKKHDIQIEMPTHDELILTGRLEDVTRFKPAFADWFRTKRDFGIPRGEMTIFTSKPRDPVPFTFDFVFFEHQILLANGKLWMFMPDPFEDRGEGGVE